MNGLPSDAFIVFALLRGRREQMKRTCFNSRIQLCVDLSIQVPRINACELEFSCEKIFGVGFVSGRVICTFLHRVSVLTR